MILSYLRTIVLYLALITVVRVMGKRQIGEMEPAEFVVTMLVANLASIPMQDGAIPLYSGLVPILTVLGVELVLSGLSLRSIRLRKALCGKPVILIENGHIMQDNLRKARITMDELSGQLRCKNILDISAVQYAILETNGELSVFPFPKFKPATAKDAGITASDQHLPITIVSDGRLLGENLRLAGKSRRWLQETLHEKQLTLPAVWLLTVDGSGKVVCVEREGKA